MTTVSTVTLTRQEYIDLAVKDPTTLYLVSDTSSTTLYLGTVVLTAGSISPEIIASVLSQTADYASNADASATSALASKIAAAASAVAALADSTSAANAAAAADTSMKAAQTAERNAEGSAASAAADAAVASDNKNAALNAAASAAHDAGVVASYLTAAQQAALDSAAYRDQTRALYDGTVAINQFTVGVATNIGTLVDGTVVSVCWSDPGDTVLASGAVLARWVRTRLMYKLGGYPEDETDGTVIVDSVVANEHQVTPATFDMGSASGYCFALFTQAATGVWNTGPEAPRFTTYGLTWATIGMLSRTGGLLAYPGMAIGSVVDLPASLTCPALRYKLAHVDYAGHYASVGEYMYDHTRVHNSIWIPDYLPCEGTSTAAMQFQFDAPELAYAETDDVEFIHTKAYYKLDDGNYVQLVENTDFAAGDSVQEYEAEHGPVYTKNHVNRTSSGQNLWLESNMRIWLNGSGQSSEYWSKQNIYDQLSANNNYATGWYGMIRQELRDVIQPVYNLTARNTIAANSGGAGGGSDITLDKVWLPSAMEVFATPINNIQEGAQFAYFRDVATTNASRIQRDESGTARYVWLRSPNSGGVYGECTVGTSGSSSGSGSSSSDAFLPAICLS